MKKTIWVLAVVLVCGLILTSCFTAKKAVAEEINWVHSFSDGQAQAKKFNKPMMVDFYTDWCGWCKKLDKDTYTDAKVIELAKKFVCVKVDAEKDEATPAKYSVRGYPTIVFLKPNGSLTDTVVGYVNSAKLLNFMQKALR